MGRDYGDELEWHGPRACRVFGKHMIERGYGRVINIGSLSSFVGLFEWKHIAPVKERWLR